MGIAADIVLIVVAGLIGGLAAHRLGLPLLVGFIVAGVLVGPHTAGPTVVQSHDIELLAEIGVALLLFALGLEVSFKDLGLVRRVALIGGPIQILLTMGLGYAIATRFLGWSQTESIWFGAVIALSSTMVVLKILLAQGTLEKLASRVMIGMLIVQDLAVAPMLIVLPKLGDVQSAAWDLVWGGLQAALFLVVMTLFGTRWIPRLLRRIAQWNSRELFLLSVVALGIGIGYGTYLCGLSFAFGAFIAGMVLSESDFSHQALSDITPLRDLFGLLFFASVGMLLDPSFLISRFGTIAAVVALVMAAKALIFGGLSRAFGYGNAAPFIVGLGLSQVGEFGFVLARSGVQSGGLSDEAYSMVLTVTLATMVLSPLVSRAALPLYRQWRRWFPQKAPLSTFALPETEFTDHVVVAGLGRIGSAAVEVMRRMERPYVVIEHLHVRAEASQRAGHPTIWGDASRDEILEAAGVRRARLMLVTVPAAASTRMIVERARQLSPELHIVARALYPEHLEELRRLGIYEVVQPEFEAGLEMVRQVLTHYDVPPADIGEFTDSVRHQMYEPLASPGRSAKFADALEQLRHADERLRLKWIPVCKGSRAAGQTIGSLEVRSRTGGSVVAVRRGDSVVSNPGPDYRFEPGDTAGFIARPDQLPAIYGLFPSDDDAIEAPAAPQGAEGA